MSETTTAETLAATRGDGPSYPPINAELDAKVQETNRLMREAYAQLPWNWPVGVVQWIHVSLVQANDYNPNAVAYNEMKLLHTSISEDGYTQPVVAIWDETAGPDRTGRHVIVDGFHRYTVLRNFPDISEQSGGYLPVVVLHKEIADRIASTVRHNRARGKHSVAGMGMLVYQMLEAGEDDATICNKLGMEPQEIARLKHITGYSKLYSNVKQYGDVVMAKAQIDGKRIYKEEHPDEVVPKF